jgi:hypothetical protein
LSTYEGLVNSIDQRRYTSAVTALALHKDRLPEHFPMHAWTEQTQRYGEYWDWWSGRVLEEEDTRTKDGELVSKFPLRVNAVRNFARKHAAILFGEVPDNPSTVVKTVVTPKRLTKNEDVERADLFQDIINEVWESNDGLSKMLENGILNQFLGGCYFQLRYVPWRRDLLIPIRVETVLPDFVLPIWGTDNPYDLNEAWIMYRMSLAEAAERFGINSGNPWVLYVEHWTRTSHSIYIDGQPLEAEYMFRGETVKVSYDNAPNPFGFVPVVYIPRIPVGNRYGNSIVPDIQGLLKEFNSRYADVGTLVMEVSHRLFFARNLSGNPKSRQFSEGRWLSDLGHRNPALGADPEVWALEAPDVSDFFNNYKQGLWEDLLRNADFSPVVFGENESSQRSSTALAVRLLPTILIVRMQRVFWNVGLSTIARHILDMVSAIQELDPSWDMGFKQKIEPFAYRHFRIKQDWFEIIPRDREQRVNEAVLLRQTDLMSIERALESLGDVDDIDQEREKIMQDLSDILERSTPQMGDDEGPEMDVPSPVAVAEIKDK